MSLDCWWTTLQHTDDLNCAFARNTTMLQQTNTHHVHWMTTRVLSQRYMTPNNHKCANCATNWISKVDSWKYIMEISIISFSSSQTHDSALTRFNCVGPTPDGQTRQLSWVRWVRHWACSVIIGYSATSTVSSAIVRLPLYHLLQLLDGWRLTVVICHLCPLTSCRELPCCY